MPTLPAQGSDGRRSKTRSRAWRRARDPSDPVAAPVQRPSGKQELYRGCRGTARPPRVSGRRRAQDAVGAGVCAAVRKASEKQAFSSSPWAMKAGAAASTIRTEPHR